VSEQRYYTRAELEAFADSPRFALTRDDLTEFDYSTGRKQPLELKRCSICRATGEHLLSCPTRWYV
jgi:hypothetical protein